MSTYSFLNVQATISGPGGTFSLGADAAIAEEGITIAMVGEKNTLTTGAGGDAMHSLHAAQAAKVTVRLLKTSPTNALLSALYGSQSVNVANWGQNVIRISQTYQGDVISCQLCAFSKYPDINYAVEGGMIEWEFDCGRYNSLLGAGVPDVNV